MTASRDKDDVRPIFDVANATQPASTAQCADTTQETIRKLPNPGAVKRDGRARSTKFTPTTATAPRIWVVIDRMRERDICTSHLRSRWPALFEYAISAIAA